MGFLFNFNFPKHTHSKECSHRKKHSFKVMRSVKNVSWIQGRSKVTPPASEQSEDSTSGDKLSLRRNLGLDNFSNILLFRTYTTCADEGFRPAKNVLNGSSPVRKDSCKTPQQELKRDLHFTRFTRGFHAGCSSLLTAVGKMQLTPWKRHSSLGAFSVYMLSYII